jgi:hypothetical protein
MYRLWYIEKREGERLEIYKRVGYPYALPSAPLL